MQGSGGVSMHLLQTADPMLLLHIYEACLQPATSFAMMSIMPHVHGPLGHIMYDSIGLQPHSQGSGEERMMSVAA